MGMFDYFHCEVPCDLTGFECQTKSTPAQSLDTYIIRADGTLWYLAYDIEDHSDPTATGLMAYIGSMTRVNLHWVRELLTGEVVFYRWDSATKTSTDYSAYFVDGILKELHKLNKTP